MKYVNMADTFQLNKTETQILKFLLKNATKEFSIKAISENIEKTYPTVWESVLKLSKENIINVKEINPTQKLCNLSLKNENNIGIFSFVEFITKREILEKKDKLKSIVDDILGRIDENSFTMIIFGSHAKGNETKGSDIDILFLIQSFDDKEKFENAVNSARMLTNEKIDAVYMTYKDFFKSLNNDNLSLSKEILEGHIIVYGSEVFYRSLMQNG